MCLFKEEWNRRAFLYLHMTCGYHRRLHNTMMIMMKIIRWQLHTYGEWVCDPQENKGRLEPHMIRCSYSVFIQFQSIIIINRVNIERYIIIVIFMAILYKFSVKYKLRRWKTINEYKSKMDEMYENYLSETQLHMQGCD